MRLILPQCGTMAPHQEVPTTSRLLSDPLMTGYNTLGVFQKCCYSYSITKHIFVFSTPITTATSLVAIAFDKGVIIAGDTLGSYGSLARFRNCSRILRINDNVILGASGDFADFQYVKDLIEQKT